MIVGLTIPWALFDRSFESLNIAPPFHRWCAEITTLAFVLSSMKLRSHNSVVSR